MNRLDRFALVAVILTTLLFARETFHIAQFYVDFLSMSGATLSIGIAGWIIATYGPIAPAVGFWRWAKRHRSPWALHLSFLPCAVSVLWVGQSLMLFVIDQPDFDAMLGGPSNQATLLFIVAVGGYLAALIWRRNSTSRHQA